MEVAGTDLELRRDEHLDNLARNGLTMLERAVALADLRRIYQALHPETREHVAGGKARQRSAGANFAPAASSVFADAVVARSERGKRTILQAAAIGEKLTEDSVARLRGTDFENIQRELEILSQQTAKRQAKILDLVLRAENPAASVTDAIARLDGRKAADAAQKALAALVDRWGRMPKASRKSFVMSLKDEQLDELAELMAERGYLLRQAQDEGDRIGEAA